MKNSSEKDEVVTLAVFMKVVSPYLGAIFRNELWRQMQELMEADEE